ncbi:MAG: hypothetical protein KAR42_00060 [candidate division Zixibacteria bacterium]|nr:hypothetical protein [candidate division Zixibacteria bacterium]
MNKKPLTIPTTIGLYILALFVPIAFPIVPIYVFNRLNQKRTGWLFSGAVVLIFAMSIIVFYILKADQEGFSYICAYLLLTVPISLIHLISLIWAIVLSKKVKEQN